MRSLLKTSLAWDRTAAATTSTITSPVSSTRSGKVPTTSGDPNALRIAASTGAEWRLPHFLTQTVPETIQRLVAILNQPAYIIGRRWDILAWNAAATEVFTDFGRLAEEDRNILVYMLTNLNARRLFGATWAEQARRMVAQFRATHDLWAGDPAFLDLLQRLRRTTFGAPLLVGSR